MGEQKLDVAAEMRRSAEAMAEHARDLRTEGDEDQAEAVSVIAAGNLEIALVVEAKDERIAALEAENVKHLKAMRVQSALNLQDCERADALEADLTTLNEGVYAYRRKERKLLGLSDEALAQDHLDAIAEL